MARTLCVFLTFLTVSLSYRPRSDPNLSLTNALFLPVSREQARARQGRSLFQKILEASSHSSDSQHFPSPPHRSIQAQPGIQSSLERTVREQPRIHSGLETEEQNLSRLTQLDSLITEMRKLAQQQSGPPVQGGVDFSQATRQEDGRLCVIKEETVDTLSKNPVLECNHKDVEKCHYTHATFFTPVQEEKCDEIFEKSCQITFRPEATTETVTTCYRPQTKICNGQGPQECKTEYKSSCTTRYVENSPGKYLGDTQCEKLPVSVCGAGCVLEEEPEECHDKEIDTLVDVPEEVCDLNPQMTCRLVTRLVPSLKPKRECTIVPKEICHFKLSQPSIERKPLRTEWCQEDIPIYGNEVGIQPANGYRVDGSKSGYEASGSQTGYGAQNVQTGYGVDDSQPGYGAKDVEIGYRAPEATDVQNGYKTKDVQTGYEAPGAKDVQIGYNAPGAKDVQTGYTAPRAKDVNTFYTSPRAKDVSTGYKAPRAKDVSTGYTAPRTKDVQIGYRAPEAKDVSTIYTAPGVKDVSTGYRVPGVKDVHTEYDATGVKDVQTVYGAPAAKDGLTRYRTSGSQSAYEAQDIQIGYVALEAPTEYGTNSLLPGVRTNDSQPKYGVKDPWPSHGDNVSLPGYVAKAAQSGNEAHNSMSEYSSTEVDPKHGAASIASSYRAELLEELRRLRRQKFGVN